MPKILGLNCHPVNSAPEAYDVVWVNFPYYEEPYHPGPDSHPGLVLNKRVFTDTATGLDYATLQIMYGTSKSQNHRDPWDYLKIHNFMALDSCGLWKETFFVADRVQRIMWSEEYMPPSIYGTPILGKLPMEYILQLKKIKDVRDQIKKLGIKI